MNRSLSTYLHGVRFLAAVLVFVAHMGHFSGWVVPFVGRSGTEAVVEFFVLSGFVVSYTARHKHPDARDYALTRLARLWSVGLPAIVLTCLFDTLGQVVNVAAYAPMMPYSAPKWIAAALANAAFLNQSWALEIAPGTNLPFWSIAYEFWYYAIFGAAFYLRGRRRAVCVLAAMLVAGPRILATFPIWLMGAALMRVLPDDRRSAAPVTGALVWCASLGLLAAFFFIDIAAWRHPASPTIAALAHLTWGAEFTLRSYLLGLILAINLYGFMLLSGSIPRVATPLAASVAWLADASFGIYLFHYPVGYLVRALLWSRGVTGGSGYVATIYLASFAVSFVLAQLFDPLRKPLLRLLRRAADAAFPIRSPGRETGACGPDRRFRAASKRG